MLVIFFICDASRARLYFLPRHQIANIIKLADDPRKWILIDWDDAGMPPVLATKHLDLHNHALAVFEDNHGSKVDVWKVRMLIKDSS